MAPRAEAQNVYVDGNDGIEITFFGRDGESGPIFKIELKCADGGFENFDVTHGTVTCVRKKDYVRVDTFTFKVIDDKRA